MLKSIPLTSIVAVLRDTTTDSASAPLEFAIALREGRVIELRAPTEQNAMLWVAQLDARVRSASFDTIPLPPIFSVSSRMPLPPRPVVTSVVPTTPVVCAAGSVSQVKSDKQVARELQAQFDAEDGGASASGSGSGSSGSTENKSEMTSLLFRLSQGGSSPVSGPPLK